MTRRLEFYFDCSSPWTYLAFTRIHDVIARTRAEIVWKPVLVGGVFNAVNQDVYERRAKPDPRKGKYYVKDLEDWARFAGIEIGRPPVFPVNSVKAMRGALIALDDGKLVPYATAVFQAYWGDLEDISQPEVLGRIASSVGYDANGFLERVEDPALKAKLRANTDELIARGGFGSPTMFVNGDDMYFGNDRLPLVEAALMRGR
ncbi:MAG: 2-hydroxychromene-2-carboxylate isomerase [Alphaproteobacteria bacterium]|nr:2-hydroxychromene-2-carboxylate isomerase [Alphaproteobacteria bacterium]